jgi:hypothetical protein
MVLTGTAIQMVQSSIEVAKFRPGAKEAVELEIERRTHRFPFHPVKWFRQQNLLRRRLWPKGGADAATRELRSTWLGLWAHVTGWALLFGAAAAGLLSSVLGG